jgi:hypothetical protein
MKNESILFPAIVLRARKSGVSRETALPLAKAGVRKTAKRTLHRLDRRAVEAQLRQQFEQVEEGTLRPMDVEKAIQFYLEALTRAELEQCDAELSLGSSYRDDLDEDFDEDERELPCELEGSLPQYMQNEILEARGAASVHLSLFEVRDSRGYHSRAVIREDDRDY